MPMMKTLAALIAAFVFTACGQDDASPARDTSAPTGPPASEVLADALAGLSLDDFYAASFSALMARSPESVVWQALGDVIPVETVALDDLSEAYRRETFAMLQVTLDALEGYDRAALDAEDQLQYDVYAWYLRDRLDQQRFLYHDFPAAYSIFGVPGGTIRFFTDIHPIETAQDARDYVTRLGQVERKFEQLVTHLRRQEDEGIIEPRLTIQITVNQITPLSTGSPDQHPYYTALRDKIDANGVLTGEARDDLLDDAEKAVKDSVLPGYRALLSTLKDLMNDAPGPVGVGQYPGGADYYAYMLRHHTTSDLTADEVHKLGLDELARIHAQMRERFDRLGYPENGSLESLYGRVAADGGTVPARDVYDTYTQIVRDAESRLDAAFDIFPEADVIVRRDPYGGFYIAPSFDGTRPGAFYAGTDRDEPRFPMKSLAYHEAVPGHHTQIALAMEGDQPMFRKLVRSTGFVEGWALYAERLAWELGWYDTDVYGDLGRLQFEALRAARLVMDTGIHSKGWTFDQAVQFNRRNVGWTQSASQGAAARYSVLPGQATAYMVGFLQILAQRERAREALGEAFDLRGFHRAVLSNGAVPLTLLDDVVDRYIADANATP